MPKHEEDFATCINSYLDGKLPIEEMGRLVRRNDWEEDVLKELKASCTLAYKDNELNVEHIDKHRTYAKKLEEVLRRERAEMVELAIERIGTKEALHLFRSRVEGLSNAVALKEVELAEAKATIKAMSKKLSGDYKE